MSGDKCKLDSFVLEAHAAGLKLMDENVEVNLPEWDIISVNDIGRGPYSRSCSDAEAKGGGCGVVDT
jgi:hypothetical protein